MLKVIKRLFKKTLKTESYLTCSSFEKVIHEQSQYFLHEHDICYRLRSGFNKPFQERMPYLHLRWNFYWIWEKPFAGMVLISLHISSVKQGNLRRSLFATFKSIKSIPRNPKYFYPYPKTSLWTPFILKNNYIKITLKKYTYKSENTPHNFYSY